jgi:hypothetical protein
VGLALPRSCPLVRRKEDRSEAAGRGYGSGTRAGVSTFKIRQQTGHASDAVLSRYVRDEELFLGNAAGVLL